MTRDNNPTNDESSQASPTQWREWLADFRRRFIEARGWDEREAKLRIKDTWVVVRDGRIQILPDGKQRPADAVPVFYILTLGGWKLPPEISECLTGWITRLLSTDQSPRGLG